MSLDANGLVTTNLGGTQVLFDSQAAPLLSAQANQVTAIVPYEVDGQTTTRLQVWYQGSLTNVVTLTVAPAAPGVFTIAGSTGQGMVMNADGTANSADNPAPAGSVVTIIATGAGQTSPPGVDGQVAVDASSMPVQPVSVQIGGADAPFISAGGLPGMVSGFVQVNVTVPPVDPGPTVAVVLTIGQAASQAGVTMAVQ